METAVAKLSGAQEFALEMVREWNARGCAYLPQSMYAPGSRRLYHHYRSLRSLERMGVLERRPGQPGYWEVV